MNRLTLFIFIETFAKFTKIYHADNNNKCQLIVNEYIRWDPPDHTSTYINYSYSILSNRKRCIPFIWWWMIDKYFIKFFIFVCLYELKIDFKWINVWIIFPYSGENRIQFKHFWEWRTLTICAFDQWGHLLFRGCVRVSASHSLFRLVIQWSECVQQCCQFKYTV